MSVSLHGRPLPSFEQWLSDNGDGTRGDGFDAFTDWIHRTLERSGDQLQPHEQSFLRMMKGLGVAVIEICNIEHERGQTPEQIIQSMPRVMAAVMVYAMASVLHEDTPWRSISKVIIEEFRFGANCAADQLSEPMAHSIPEGTD